MDKVYFSILQQQNLLLDDKTNEYHHHIPSNTMNQGYYQRFFVEGELLGRGARGTVHLTSHVLQGEELGKFAIKKIPVGDDVNWLLKTIKEVHILEGLHHKNLISYRHSWVEVFQPSIMGPPVPGLFILMEYANYGDLSLLFKEKTSLDDEINIISLMKGCAFGLQYLHTREIVHGDIKPENILLTKDHIGFIEVLISDFGECKEGEILSNHQQRTGHTGTIEYCAPELYKCDKDGSFLFRPSVRTDIWSLGMVFYYMVSGGKLPWTQVDDFDALLEELLFLENINYSQIHNNTLKNIVKQMLVIDPMKRISIDKVVEMLMTLDDGNVDLCDGDVDQRQWWWWQWWQTNKCSNIKIGILLLFILNLFLCYPISPSIIMLMGWISILMGFALLRKDYDDGNNAITIYGFISLFLIGSIFWYNNAICAI